MAELRTLAEAPLVFCRSFRCCRRSRGLCRDCKARRTPCLLLPRKIIPESAAVAWHQLPRCLTIGETARVCQDFAGADAPRSRPPGEGSSSADALKLPVPGRRRREPLIPAGAERLRWALGVPPGSHPVFALALASSQHHLVVCREVGGGLAAALARLFPAVASGQG